MINPEMMNKMSEMVKKHEEQEQKEKMKLEDEKRRTEVVKEHLTKEEMINIENRHRIR